MKLHAKIAYKRKPNKTQNTNKTQTTTKTQTERHSSHQQKNFPQPILTEPLTNPNPSISTTSKSFTYVKSTRAKSKIPLEHYYRIQRGSEMLSSMNLTFSTESCSLILLSQFKNRGRVGIVADILDTVMRSSSHGRTKTQIMRGARLNYEQTNRYLDLLLLCSLIHGVKLRYGDKELIRYFLTPNGLDLFKQLHTLHSAMQLLDHKSL